MTTTKLIAYWPLTVTRAIRKWWLRRKLAHIGYALAHIAEQDEHNRHARRHLQAQMALIQSDIRNI